MIQPYRVEHEPQANKNDTYKIISVGDGTICQGIRDISKAYVIAELLNHYEAAGVVREAARRAAARG